MSQILYLYVTALLLCVTGINCENKNEEDAFSKVLTNYFNKAFQCKKEFEDSGKNFDIGECMVMFDGDDDPKFDVCKEYILCVSKKTNLIKEDGQYNIAEHEYIVNALEPKFGELIKEYKTKVVPACKGVSGINSELLYKYIKCALKNSPMAMNVKDMFVGLFKKKDIKN
ncbi:uncharacterized protein LOC142332031 [Lycorma delicatula]|uniref:uncharacterized protein LOC142332031 n=1 Tax=Lycorma delicatula TaxID=130591 RepID=UPI003F5113F5